MKLRSSTRAILVAVVTLACGPTCSSKGSGSGPTIQVSANPKTLPIVLGANASYTTITVTGTDSGSAWIDGQSLVPTITTDYGQFDTAPSITAGGVGDIRTKNDGQIMGHAVTVRLYPDPTPPDGNIATVTATYVDSYGSSVTGTVQITVLPQAPAEHLSFSCSTYNIAVLANQDTSIEIPCNATATDAHDRQIDGANVQFLAEAGTMQYDPQNPNQVAYFPTDPGAIHASPVDVDPSDLDNYAPQAMGGPCVGIASQSAPSAEPYWIDANNLTHNPRDGLVSIVAYVPADPAAVAAEGLGEPFVDANDNGIYDATANFPEVPEDFVDLNDNGVYDAVQSADHTTVLWKQIKILWTGTLQNNPPVATVSPPTADLQYQQTTTFVLSLLDQNMNVLANNDSTQDLITWYTMPPQDLSLAPGQTSETQLYNPADQRRLGMVMDTNFCFTSPSSSSNWGISGSYSVTVENTYQCTTTLVAEGFTVQGNVVYTQLLGPTGDPQNSTSINTLGVGGTLEPPTSTTCTSTGG
jgi:hypothetical protein